MVELMDLVMHPPASGGEGEGIPGGGDVPEPLGTFLSLSLSLSTIFCSGISIYALPHRPFAIITIRIE